MPVNKCYGNRGTLKHKNIATFFVKQIENDPWSGLLNEILWSLLAEGAAKLLEVKFWGRRNLWLFPKLP